MAATTTKIPGSLFRAGYAAKGVIYTLVGVLAIQAAATRGGPVTGTGGALEYIGTQPFGQVILWLLAVGLFGYAMWRFVDGILDVEGRGTDNTGVLQRAGIITSGIIHTALGILAIRIATATGGAGGDTKREATAWLMSQPVGVWLVGLVGVGVVAFGLYQLWLALEGYVTKHIVDVSPERREQLRAVSRAGFAARGLTFCVIGALILQAAATHDPSDVGGLDRALQTMAAQPYGPWVLGLVALGLVCYGIYCFSVAYFGRFPDVEISGDTVRRLPSETTAH